MWRLFGGVRSRSPGWLLPLVLFLLACTVLQAADSWEGIAAVSRRGEFDGDGLLAASNSFPEDTRITVLNLRNRRSIEVTVVRRLEEGRGVFLLLSQTAAQRLGLSPGQVARVQARIATGPGAEVATRPVDHPFSQDPDVNPASSVSPLLAETPTTAGEQPPGEAAAGGRPEEGAAAEGTSLEEKAPEEAPPEETPPEVTPPKVRPPEVAVPEQKPPEVRPPEEQPAPEEAPTSQAEIAAAPPEEQEPQAEPEAQAAEQEQQPAPAAPDPRLKRLEKIEDRLPQKQHFLPPREDERFALAGPTEKLLEEITEEAAKPGPTETTEEAGAEAAEGQPEPGETLEEAITQAPPEQIEEAPGPVPEEPQPPVEPETPPPAEPGPPEAAGLAGPPPEHRQLQLALPGPEPEEPQTPAPQVDRLPGSHPEAEPQADLAAALPEVQEPQEAERVAAETPPEEKPAETGEEVVKAPQEPETQEPQVSAETPPPEKLRITLEPSEPRPPQEQAQPGPTGEQPAGIAEAKAPEAEPAAEQPAAVLPRGSYFVQLGAYSSRLAAEDLARTLGATYGTAVLPAPAGSTTVYKVLIGPLNVDESGAVLYNFRARGFKDAFIKHVD